VRVVAQWRRDDMVNQEGGPTQSSRVRREREEENAGAGTPSKKRRHGGRNEVAEAAPDVSGKGTPTAGEEGNNGTVEGSAERNLKEGAEAGGDGNEVSGDPSAAAAATPEGAARAEAGAQEVYRIPSYAGV
jgi:hypothetical protein